MFSGVKFSQHVVYRKLLKSVDFFMELFLKSSLTRREAPREHKPPVAYLRGGGPCAMPPFGRTAVIFVTILGLFLAPFRDKIATTSDQMRFFGRKML